VTRVFADTSFYIAFINPRDSLHEKASAFSSSFQGTFVTTEYVLVELGNWFSSTENRGIFVEYCRRLTITPTTIVVDAQPELFKAGLELNESRGDKSWSLTDCISFEIMKQLGIAEAATADHHFEQAGFRMALPR